MIESALRSLDDDPRLASCVSVARLTRYQNDGVSRPTMATIDVRLLPHDVVHGSRLRAACDNRSPEGEARNIFVDAMTDDVSAKRAAFLARTAELRNASEGRAQTPGEFLIRKDRDHGH